MTKQKYIIIDTGNNEIIAEGHDLEKMLELDLIKYFCKDREIDYNRNYRFLDYTMIVYEMLISILEEKPRAIVIDYNDYVYEDKITPIDFSKVEKILENGK